MRRREFIAGFGGAAVWPVVARAQQPSQKARIGALLPGTPAAYSPRTNALLKGLRDLGYEEGKTVTIEWKWWSDQAERLPELAAELVTLDVQPIVTAGTTLRLPRPDDLGLARTGHAKLPLLILPLCLHIQS